MSEANKARADRIPLEMFNKGDIAVGDKVFAADFVEHLPMPPGMPLGLAGLKLFVQAIRAAFPDFHYVVNRSVAEGDLVVQHVTASGTMKGDFAGMKASGKRAQWDEIHISRWGGDQLVEHWAVVDQLGMLTQLGFVPPPPA